MHRVNLHVIRVCVCVRVRVFEKSLNVLFHTDTGHARIRANGCHQVHLSCVRLFAPTDHTHEHAHISHANGRSALCGFLCLNYQYNYWHTWNLTWFLTFKSFDQACSLPPNLNNSWMMVVNGWSHHVTVWTTLLLAGSRIQDTNIILYSRQRPLR